MKILHLITRLILGGAQENTLLSCEGQAERGHQVTLAFGPIYGPEGSLLERARTSASSVESRGGYELVELPAMIRALHPLADLRCYRQCRELIRRIRPDVVHTHSSKAGIIGRAAAWAERVPAVVHTVHGLPYHPYQNRLMHRGYVMAERWAAKRCHKIVCVADAMTRQALAAGIGKPEQYQTIYSGMEVEPYLHGPDDRDATRAALGISGGDMVIGTVARLAELKGHDDLLEALGPLLRERPGIPGVPGLKLLWVGDGWLRKTLEQKLDSMRLKGRVVITGLVDPSRIPSIMRAMDLLVHPSYREGLARALPQALLSGTAIVSYDGDGAGEVCIDGTTGRLVPTGDLAALGDAVAWMIDHPEQRSAMAEEGRRRCAERFDHRVMVRELEALYERLIG